MSGSGRFQTMPSADAEHVLGLVAPLRALAGAHAGRLGLLALADQGEEAAEALVLEHGRLGDASQLVECAVGHAAALVADFQPAIGEVHDLDPPADRSLGELGRFDQEEDVVVLECQGLRQRPLGAPGEGLVQPIYRLHGPMQVLVVERRLGEAGVVVGHEARQEGVAVFHLLTPARRSSFTRRSCKVLFARSTRPLAWLELAQMISMLSAFRARPNWVMPSPCRPLGLLTRKTACLSV